MKLEEHKPIEDILKKSDVVFKTSEVSEIIGISVVVINRLFDREFIKGYHVPGSKHRRVPYNSLMEFMNKNFDYEDIRKTMTERVERYISKIKSR